MTDIVAHIGIAEIRSPKIRQLHAYWDRLRRGAVGPRRADIAPEDLSKLLPNLLIVDVERRPPAVGTAGETLRFRYRLVGTTVVQYNGMEFTGKYLGEIGWPEEAGLIRSYTEIATTGQPAFGIIAWDMREGSLGRSEYGCLPLSEDGVTVSQVIALEDYEFTAMAGARKPEE